MREYYGSLEECKNYIEDKNHKAVPWKEYPFSFELKNSTKYILEVKRKNPFMHILATLEPQESIEVCCNNFFDGELEVSVKENSNPKCSFQVDSGYMVGRDFIGTIENGKEYLAPIFKNGTVEIVTCKDCSSNFGVMPKYEVRPLEQPVNKVKFINNTGYNLIISYDGKVIQKIESRKTEEVDVPRNGILYIDTETEEVEWQWVYKLTSRAKEKSILRVNGCCIEIRQGTYYQSVDILGPGNFEPYINYLYASGQKFDDAVSIWCNNYDDRMD